MAAVCQQVLALDARYNAYRTPSNPQFRTLYIRRRSQLLRENAKEDRDPAIRRDYMRSRSMLLAQRYGVTAMSEVSSVRSRTVSLRSINRNNMESMESLNMIGLTMKDRYDSLRESPHQPSNVVPTIAAEASSDGDTERTEHHVVPTCHADASRAMVGDTSISENYAFTGMHHIFDQHKSAVTSLKFAHDDKSRLACCSLDGTISVCQVIPPPATVVCVLQGHSKGITDVVWSLSNDRLLSSSLDGSSCLWHVARGECLRRVMDPAQAEVICCAFHPLNNNLFVTGNGKCMVQVMNLSTGKVAKGGTSKTLGRVFAVCFESSGRVLWAGDDKGFIFSFTFDLVTGRINKAKRITVCEGHCVTCISHRTWISREARDPSLLVNCGMNALCLFKVITEDGGLLLKKKFPVKHKSAIIRSTFCPLMSFRQGACVVSGSEDCVVHFFDVERDSKPCVNKLLGHSAPVLDVCFNYDESMLASCDASGTVIIWKRDMRT